MAGNPIAGSQIPPLPPGKTVAVYGQKIHYYQAGDGPAVILLHGLGLDATFWTFVIPALSRTHRVYAVDMLGFGRSDKPPLEYSIETFVEFLEGFMRQAGIPKATLVGLSLGGWIAAEFATFEGRKWLPVQRDVNIVRVRKALFYVQSIVFGESKWRLAAHSRDEQ